MKILVACEFTQIVTKAFRDRGHEAYSCDLLPTEGNPEWHIQGDVLQHLRYCPTYRHYDLMIAHPPCTRICNSGVRWLAERNLWDDLDKACEFFNSLINAPINKIAIENPIPHKYAVKKIGKYNQIIQPWQFGHGETKATCLWLKGLRKLGTTRLVAGREQRIFNMMPKTAERGKLRSRTFPGIAKAMAEQWG